MSTSEHEVGFREGQKWVQARIDRGIIRWQIALDLDDEIRKLREFGRGSLSARQQGFEHGAREVLYHAINAPPKTDGVQPTLGPVPPSREEENQ
jgi:hypothetical protein